MSIRKENFFVISGGPGVGKTTLINELKNSGFEIVEENARKIIKNQIDTNQEGLPWKNKEKYAKLMLEESIKSYQNEVSVKNVNPVFF
ncbi:AAA family ATPase [Empedobacter tilapiae]